MTDYTTCGHHISAICWLCDEGPAWWHELRVKRGYGDVPPYYAERQTMLAPYRLRAANLREAWQEEIKAVLDESPGLDRATAAVIAGHRRHEARAM